MALTPTQIEELRAIEAKQRGNLNLKSSLMSFDIDQINNSVPGNLKPQGQQKLPSLILSQNGNLLSKVIPALDEYKKKFGLDKLSSTDETDIESLKAQYCPTPIELEKLINQRNNLVGYINGIGQKLDSLSLTVEFGAGFGTLLQGLINRIKQTQTLSNIAMSFIPLALPGAVPATINTLGNVADTLTFNEDGSPKLPPITITASQVSPAIASVQSTILKIVTQLNQLDNLIKLCDPYSSLDSLSDSIKTTANTELLAKTSDNKTTYKGFILEIEEKPFSPTVSQRRAVGKNNSEIVLISTGYSFASNPNVLIEELKFIIDKDDLKAY